MSVVVNVMWRFDQFSTRLAGFVRRSRLIIVLHLAEMPVLIDLFRLFKICVTPDLLVELHVILFRACVGVVVRTNDIFISLLGVTALGRAIRMLRVTGRRNISAFCNSPLSAQTLLLSLEAFHLFPVSTAHSANRVYADLQVLEILLTVAPERFCVSSSFPDFSVRGRW